MRILIVDDDSGRQSVMLERLPNHDVTVTSNWWQAISLLRDEPRFDVVYLDHDLADFDDTNVEVGMYNNHVRSGMDVVSYMVGDMPEEKRPLKTIVHSRNWTEGPKMVQKLEEAGFRVEYTPYEPEPAVLTAGVPSGEAIPEVSPVPTVHLHPSPAQGPA